MADTDIEPTDMLIPISWLDEAIEHATGEARRSHSEAMNSYGAGYDAGVCDTLKKIKEGKFDE